MGFSKDDRDRAKDMSVKQALDNVRGVVDQFNGKRRDIVLLDQSIELIEQRLDLCEKYETAEKAAKAVEDAKNAAKALEDAKKGNGAAEAEPAAAAPAS